MISHPLCSADEASKNSPWRRFRFPFYVFVMQSRPLSSYLSKCFSMTPAVPKAFFFSPPAPQTHTARLQDLAFIFKWHIWLIDSPSLYFFARMTPGLSCTPLPSSRRWATCCASDTAAKPRKVCQISGSPCWVWLWEPLATLSLSATQQHSSNPWTPPDGNIKKR